MPAFDESHLPNIARERRLTTAKPKRLTARCRSSWLETGPLRRTSRMAFWRAALLMMNTYALR